MWGIGSICGSRSNNEPFITKIVNKRKDGCLFQNIFHGKRFLNIIVSYINSEYGTKEERQIKKEINLQIHPFPLSCSRDSLSLLEIG